jgi:hypothetical protein
MNRFAIILMLSYALAGHGAERVPGSEVAYSQSGQFVVTGRSLPPAAARVLAYDPNFKRFVPQGWTAGQLPDSHGASSTNALTLKLDPNYLVATAERLRLLFNDVLELTEPYRGRIFIHLLEGADPASEITFLSAYDREKQTWNCKLTMPSEIAPERLRRVLIQALMFEASHRGAGEGGCEIPLWFSEGLIAHLEARTAGTAVMEPNQGVNQFLSPVEEADRLRGEIGSAGCLTLEQLSWPGTLERKPGLERSFEVSSQALVMELLGLPNGGRCLGQFVRLLSHYQNWQFAFLNSFRSHFPSLLEAEKWWAVDSLHLGGRATADKWTLAESLKRLDRALVLPVERRTGAGDEVFREEMDLRTIINTMTFERQKLMLARVISALFALELRADPRLVRLVGDFRGTLEKYVGDRADAINDDFEHRRRSGRQEFVLEHTLKQLDTLVQLRQDFEILLPREAAPDRVSPPTVAAAAR